MQHPNRNQSLVTLVEHYTPIDATEADHKTTILNLLYQQPNPLDSDCYEPGHATGSAWVVSKSTQQVALIYHQHLQRWLQPGGHAEPHEPDLQTVSQREAQEELGIQLDAKTLTLFDLDVHRIPASKSRPSHWHFDFRYLCLTDFQPLTPATDAMQAKWFSRSDLETLTIDPGIERMIEKSRSLLC
jgi:8-oxo-dGTP pyrophosphatase MutT (NUDIX family)